MSISEAQAAGTAVYAAASLPTYSVQQISDYLRFGTNGGLTIAGTDTPITVNLTGLSAQRAGLARLALATWSDICDISFTETTGAATISFTQNQSGAFCQWWSSGSSITAATVNVAANWEGGDSSVDGYTFQTFIHEIGHALGLGHAGPYDGSGTYATDAIYANDSWQMTVMSYFSQEEAGQGSYRFVMTPMMADIYAVRAMYGRGTTHAGNTVYGFNSTVLGATAALYDFANYSEAPSYTIVDDAGTDTLNASGYAVNQLIDLRAGRFSNIGGLTGNIGIALGVIIENANGGSGDDRLIGNSYVNVIYGNAGDDTFYGYGGDDRLLGGTGNDIFDGGAGNDRLYGQDGNDRLVGGVGNDLLEGGTGSDSMTGGAGDDTYYVDSIGDVVVEVAGEGFDTVRTTLSRYTLGTSVERLIYTGSSSFTGVGNNFSNTITGGRGNDRLWGGGGNDTLTGGVGADTLTGGSGRDTFVYTTVSDSNRSTYDTLTDFSTAAGDRLNLSAIDANTTNSGVNDAFVYVGSSAFSGTAGELRLANGLLQGDVNGDSRADLVIAVGSGFTYSSSSLIV
ncbi:M10 family metallopeptidase [Xanthobacter variabilis]|uniref:M10 family metallopeptidase n=1 Tax=Xanthobacter variabilis TaxID=3119932 RepID=UPI00374EE878